GAKDGDSIPLALEPEPTMHKPPSMSSKRTPVEKSVASRLLKEQQAVESNSPSEAPNRRPSLPRAPRSVMGMPTTSSVVQKPKQR
ncbi:hypothetical protein PFISCL1PPCAC_22822, partial [Pristionchus fissidentatus]